MEIKQVEKHKSLYVHRGLRYKGTPQAGSDWSSEPGDGSIVLLPCTPTLFRLSPLSHSSCCRPKAEHRHLSRGTSVSGEVLRVLKSV